MSGKTRTFKEKQCGNCIKADARAFRKGWPCCPLDNPQIRTGHCTDREPRDKALIFKTS